MKVSSVTESLSVQLDDTTNIHLDLREAYGLMMFATGVAWSKDGLTNYSGSLAKPFVFKDTDNAWPPQTTHRFVASGNAVDTEGENVPYQTVNFILGPHVDQLFVVERVELMRLLSKALIDVTGIAKLALIADNYHLSEEKYIPTGPDGVFISNASYVNLYVNDQYGIPRRLVDVDAFNGNKNLKRAPHVDKLVFATDTYFGEFHRTEERSMLQLLLSSGPTLMKDA